MDESEKIKVKDKLAELFSFHFGDRPELVSRAVDIVLVMKENRATETINSLTGMDIARKLPNYPAISVRKTCYALEKKGFLDRLSKFEGFYVSRTFLRNLERQREVWNYTIRV